MHEWADTHGEVRMSMRQLYESEAYRLCASCGEQRVASEYDDTDEIAEVCNLCKESEHGN